jgi:isoquinoline 1-oxidoreductase beta subunit
MTSAKVTFGRRSFIQSTVLAGGGMMLGFNWLAPLTANPGKKIRIPDEWFGINGYLKIGANGVITILSPNPEAGQHVKTSMPMIVAEELDVDWNKVIVEQAPLNTEIYTNQTIGGSLGVRMGWKNLRTAGAVARQMLMMAAAQEWNVPVAEITTDAGVLFHKGSGKSAGYEIMASAAAKMPVPKEVNLKDPKNFKLIGTSQKNVDGLSIVTGKPMFGMDTRVEGMLIAMIVHPGTFGMKLKSYDDSVSRAMPGIKDIFQIKTLADDYGRQQFDICTFTDLVAIVGNTTWEVMQAKKALKVEWEQFSDYTETRTFYGNTRQVIVPAGLENTADHYAKMEAMAGKPGTVRRKDGDPETAFKNAAGVIERTYTAPFLDHACMEPMNFFAHMTDEKVFLLGPLQKPALTRQAVSTRLGVPPEKIEIQMTRLGGGFGRRSYAHWLIEAALISQKIKAPVKLVYSREDDMTSGIYRPAYNITFRAALDTNNNMTAFHVNAGGIPDSPVVNANSFPAGAVENYLVEDWNVNSNITVGSFRGPRHNFYAGAEQSFLDEVAETAGKDPIDFRLELLGRARANPVGQKIEYDPGRFAGVLELLREKSGWGKDQPNVHRGVAAYYCQGSYAGEVLDITMADGKPVISRVCCAVDCGILVNPDGAASQAEGCIVDGIGVAMYGGITFTNGVPDQDNLEAYTLIWNSEAPKSIDVHFVKSDLDPSGVGEPPYPPIMGALANALYRATGKRHYNQPFVNSI